VVAEKGVELTQLRRSRRRIGLDVARRHLSSLVHQVEHLIEVPPGISEVDRQAALFLLGAERLEQGFQCTG